MTNNTDSFIDEVTDEVRRDRFLALLRKFGWIAVLVILVIVGWTAWREYDSRRDRHQAQTWGDAFLSARDSGDPAALLALDPQGVAARKALAGMTAAEQLAQAGDNKGAIAALRQVAEANGKDPLLHDMARLKEIMLAGDAMDPAERDATLSKLSETGRPFRLLALEMKAIALMNAGRRDDATALIEQIQREDGLSLNLRQRLSQMMVVMGVEPQPEDSLPDLALPDAAAPAATAQ